MYQKIFEACIFTYDEFGCPGVNRTLTPNYKLYKSQLRNFCLSVYLA